ncbi:DUF1697 domain-containing protein [Pedosphaera parvula]|uniref:DUF1697 domain-containing protein n=1 Tax=Pedosphaera parvula (strain Ellin514) TaxID=320771 RepID=B9XNZ7_PEDPL|nr:DUF1697 domain-containing protein [Pedosphaera parvula]EEF58463.1 protein of unknown function DUF1697 [Pedosphaera parvula Ellin514]
MKKTMIRYVALLRGINVGGHKPVKMEGLKKSFEAVGFEKVKTVLASGNVLFESVESDEGVLVSKIGAHLKKDLGHEVGVLVRSMEEIQSLVERNPFKKIQVTPETRLYVTFLSQKVKSKLKIPYETPEKDFRILSASEREVCSVLVLSPERQTTELMNIVEKEFGKQVTTRNWNTVLRISKG